jgi:hypothetical protein
MANRALKRKFRREIQFQNPKTFPSEKFENKPFHTECESIVEDAELTSEKEFLLKKGKTPNR